VALYLAALKIPPQQTPASPWLASHTIMLEFWCRGLWRPHRQASGIECSCIDWLVEMWITKSTPPAVILQLLDQLKCSICAGLREQRSLVYFWRPRRCCCRILVALTLHRLGLARWVRRAHRLACSCLKSQALVPPLAACEDPQVEGRARVTHMH
jgi:hypothetical protein